MKTTSKILLLFIFLLPVYRTNAQVNTSSRPYLFSNFSETIPVVITELDKAFNLAEGSFITLKFSNQFSFSGIISSSVHKYNNLISVIIKSSSLHNAILTISKRINDDDTITYVGRIINEKYADGYELKKSNTGTYAFNKIKTEDLIQDY